MSFYSFSLKALALGVTLGAVALGTAGAASAANAKFDITNDTGTSMYLDSSSCSGGHFSSIVPWRISAGETKTITGESSGWSVLCTVKYTARRKGGCSFSVQASDFGGFASASRFSGSPTCNSVGRQIPRGYLGTFNMR